MTSVNCRNVQKLIYGLFVPVFVCLLRMALTTKKQNCPNSTSQRVFVMETVCSL